MPPRTKAGNDFGNEIERMLLDRPATRQAGGKELNVGTVASATATLDDLMAELHGGRGPPISNELPGADRQPAKVPQRTGALSSSQDGPLRAGGKGGEVSMPPIQHKSPAQSAPTPRLSFSGGGMGPSTAASSFTSQATLPSLANWNGASGSPAAPTSSGAMRSQSPMTQRRSVAGGPGGPVGPTQPSFSTGGGPASDRQGSLESRVEKMEAREQQLMMVIAQLQQQVATLTRHQQIQQQQLNSQPTTPTAAAAAAAQKSFDDVADHKGAAPGLERLAEAMAQMKARLDVLEDVGSMVGRSPGSTTDATIANAVATKGPSAQLTAKIGAAADWEPDLHQFRKELGSLAANLVTVKQRMEAFVETTQHKELVEEVAEQAAAAGQLKQYLTQLAGDMVSLQRGLQGLKQHIDKTAGGLQQQMTDALLQAQTNSFVSMASGGSMSQGPSKGDGGVWPSYGSVASLSQSSGGGGGLEESFRNAFQRSNMRQLPAFSDNDPALDNSNMASAVAAFGGGGGGGGRRGSTPMLQQGGPVQGGQQGLNAAMALLNSFEEQAVQEQQEQRHAAVIAKQAVMLIDAKVKQVVTHVDRHMGFMQQDVEDRLRMYEQTIIKMAQQIDRIIRTIKEMDTAPAPLVITQGPMGTMVQQAPKEHPKDKEEKKQGEGEGEPAAKANWVKAVAAATGRFAPPKEEAKKADKNPHGYFSGYK